MRKSVVAATMAASLTLGGAAGMALFTPSVSNATVQVDDTTDGATVDREPGARLAEILDPLVQNGTIDQSQSDAVVAAILEAGPPDGGRGHRGPGHRGQFGEVLTEVLGLDVGEIRSAFEQGTTLRALAEQQGVDPDAVVEAIVAAAEEHLAQAVEDGRLTQDEADARLAEARQRAEDSLDAARPRHPGHVMGGPEAQDATN